MPFQSSNLTKVQVVILTVTLTCTVLFRFRVLSFSSLSNLLAGIKLPFQSSKWTKVQVVILTMTLTCTVLLRLRGRIILIPLRSSRWNNTAISLSVIKMSKVQVAILTRIAYERVHCTVQIEGTIIPSPLRSYDWSKTAISVMKNDPNPDDCG